MNEILIISSLVISYGSVLLWYKFLGKTGLYCYTVLATIAANIEVLILVDAFSIEMTLGNVLFATTFIATDILSETEGKDSANLAVKCGIATSITFIIFSQLWLRYIPSKNDFAMESIKTLFSSTPRLMFSSLVVYAVAQLLDVYLYHKIWEYTEKHFNDKKRFLWFRNNVATLTSQLINSLLFNLFAFYGTYSNNTLIAIIVSTFTISIFTSLLDTPIVYIARSMKEKMAFKAENKII